MSDQTNQTAAVLDHDTKTGTRPTAQPRKPRRPILWNVVLLDDDHHSYGYVMGMMCSLFYKSVSESFKMAQMVDSQGRVICETCMKERAEFKRDQILAFGRDPANPLCAGSMSAVIEPALCGDNDDNKDDNRDATHNER